MEGSRGVEAKAWRWNDGVISFADQTTINGMVGRMKEGGDSAWTGIVQWLQNFGSDCSGLGGGGHQWLKQGERLGRRRTFVISP